MTVYVNYVVILEFIFILESSQNITTYWNPCPRVRSSFDGIFKDNNGGLHPSCVCSDGYFGENCSLKVYVSDSVINSKRSTSVKQPHPPGQTTHPFKYIRVHRYPNGSTIVQWQHSVIISLNYYTLHFRPVQPTQDSSTSKWKPLVNFSPGNNTNMTLYSYTVQDFLNSTTYEINIAIVGNADEILVSISFFSDPLNSSLTEKTLTEMLYHPSVFWSNWGNWGKCETTKRCGKGRQTRTRFLKSQCIKDKMEEKRFCKLKQCPVNGRWSKWSSWTRCSGSCNGTRSRTRTCTSPAPKYGGKFCFGTRIKKSFCKNRLCGLLDNHGRLWPTFQNLGNINFTSLIVGAAGGFILCLLLISCPRLLKRYMRSNKKKYHPISNKDLQCVNPPSKIYDDVATLLPPPQPPPPPPPPFIPAFQHSTVVPSSAPQFPPPSSAVSKTKNWKTLPGTHNQKQMQQANDRFMIELLKAFQTFNVIPTDTTTDNNATIHDRKKTGPR